jgi:hypothetical protein
MTGKETVVNRALSGDELKKIILADCQRLVDNEGMLSPLVAFGRVGYTITLRLHMDNPYVPNTEITMESAPIAGNLLAGHEELAAIDRAPLAGATDKAEVGAMELERRIDSPNAERLREGMPIPVQTRQQDGTTQMESIAYPKDTFPEVGAGDVKIADVTESAKVAWAVKPTP